VLDVERELTPLRPWREAAEASPIATISTVAVASNELRAVRTHLLPARSIPEVRVAAASGANDTAALGFEYLLAALAGALTIAAFIVGRIAMRERAAARISPDLVPPLAVIQPSPTADEATWAPWRRVPTTMQSGALSYAPARGRAGRDPEAAAAVGPAPRRATGEPAPSTREDEDIEAKLQRLLNDWQRAAA
jgi:hypothetical protein